MSDVYIAQSVKNPPAKQETQVPSLGWEDPLAKEMTTHSSILAWRTPWTEEPGRLQPTGSRVGHDLVTKPPPCPTTELGAPEPTLGNKTPTRPNKEPARPLTEGVWGTSPEGQQAASRF